MRRSAALLAAALLALAALSAPAAGGPGRAVRVYYFHTTARCATCRAIESLAEKAVRDGFAQEIREGRVEWASVNVEEPPNRHFVTDYGLYTKSVVLVEVVDGVPGRHRNLPKVWELVREEGLFTSYVRRELRAFLDGGA